MPQNSHLVSVVIPAYRVSEYIGQTVDSVMQQTVPAFEVIVVNDCCPDSENLDKALERFRGSIRYIRHPENRGLAAARNSGIRAASGEWVAFLDGDDFWFPDYLEVQLRVADAFPGSDLIFGNARIIGSRDDGKPARPLSPSNGVITLVELLSETRDISVMNITRRSAIIAAGGFDESLRRCEDFELWTRMLINGAVVRYHSRVIAGYRRRSGSLSADVVKMFESRMRVLEKLEPNESLKPAERAAMGTTRLRWQAEMELELGKASLARQEYRLAATHIASANRYLRRPHLWLIGLLLSYCPVLVRTGARLRMAWLGY
jgi:glycosyltransferase involved in cell wall biosynthesis